MFIKHQLHRSKHTQSPALTSLEPDRKQALRGKHAWRSLSGKDDTYAGSQGGPRYTDNTGLAVPRNILEPLPIPVSHSKKSQISLLKENRPSFSIPWVASYVFPPFSSRFQLKKIDQMRLLKLQEKHMQEMKSISWQFIIASFRAEFTYMFLCMFTYRQNPIHTHDTLLHSPSYSSSVESVSLFFKVCLVAFM